MPINAFSWPFSRALFYFCSCLTSNKDVDDICQCHYDWRKNEWKNENSTHEKWISLKCSTSYIMRNFQLFNIQNLAWKKSSLKSCLYLSYEINIVTLWVLACHKAFLKEIDRRTCRSSFFGLKTKMTDKNVVVAVYALLAFITIVVIEFSIQLDLLYTF